MSGITLTVQEKDGSNKTIQIEEGNVWRARSNPDSTGTIINVLGASEDDYSFKVKVVAPKTGKVVELPYRAKLENGQPAFKGETIQGFFNSWCPTTDNQINGASQAAAPAPAPAIAVVPQAEPAPEPALAEVMDLTGGEAEEPIDLTGNTPAEPVTPVTPDTAPSLASYEAEEAAALAAKAPAATPEPAPASTPAPAPVQSPVVEPEKPTRTRRPREQAAPVADNTTTAPGAGVHVHTLPDGSLSIHVGKITPEAVEDMDSVTALAMFDKIHKAIDALNEVAVPVKAIVLSKLREEEERLVGLRRRLGLDVNPGNPPANPIGTAF